MIEVLLSQNDFDTQRAVITKDGAMIGEVVSNIYKDDRVPFHNNPDEFKICMVSVYHEYVKGRPTNLSPIERRGYVFVQCIPDAVIGVLKELIGEGD